MAFLALLVLGLGLGLGLGFASASASAFYSDRDGWDWVSSSAIARLNASEFKDMATPLVQMCANTYRFPRSVAIQGWKPSARVSAIGPSTGGVHAIAYEQEEAGGGSEADDADEPTVVVVAFRGTQISDPLQSLADLCGGMLLWGEFADYSSLPVDCTSNFNESTLDYLHQAIAFTELAIRAYPNAASLLLTGHSLGAGLAILVSKVLFERRSVELPVIAFSARGPGGNALFSKMDLSDDLDHVITIALEWDEVVRASWDDQVGLLCLYEQDEPSSCQACFSTTNTSSSSSLPSASSSSRIGEEEKVGNLTASAAKFLAQGDCWTCFLETHILKIVIDAVAKGEKPVCRFICSHESNNNNNNNNEREKKKNRKEKNCFTKWNK
jgi:hypothetical protein